MASNNQPFYGQAFPTGYNQQFPGYGIANKLNPDGSYADAGPQNIQPQQGATANPTLPSWLTDLSARGIGDDWSPSIGATPGDVQLHPRVIPPDPAPPPAAQVAQYVGAPTGAAGAPSLDSGGAHGAQGGSGGAAFGTTTITPSGPSGYIGGYNLGAVGTVGNTIANLAGYDAGGVSPRGNYGPGTQSTGGFSPGAASGLDSAQYHQNVYDIARDGGGSGGGGNSNGTGNYGPGTQSTGGFSSGAASGSDSGPPSAKGGVITPNKLLQNAPPPGKGDSGYASIQDGEGVLTRAAMKKYGSGFLAKLNKLAVPVSSTR